MKSAFSDLPKRNQEVQTDEDSIGCRKMIMEIEVGELKNQ